MKRASSWRKCGAWYLVGVMGLLFVVPGMGEVLADDLNGLKDGVVKITSTLEGRSRVGSGIIVKTDGKVAYIVTVSHVIEGDPAPQISFHGKPNRKFPGEIIGLDSRNPKGLAVLMVQAPALPTGVQPLLFDQAIGSHAGEDVTLIGFPRLPPVPWAVTRGVVTGQVGQDLILSGKASEGNSGGPVIQDDRVIGVVTEVTDGYVYAVPVVIAKVALRGWGISLEEGSGMPLAKLPKEEPSSDIATESSTRRIEPEKDVILNLPPGESVTDVPGTIDGKDGGSMVLIPEGTFFMGTRPDDVCEWDSIVKVEFCVQARNADYAPQHTVTLDTFYLDIYEVTVERFKKFIKDTGYSSTVETKGRQTAVIEAATFFFGKSWEAETVEEADWQRPLGKSQDGTDVLPHHPVVQVSWFDANAYCEWAGKRLPSEAEWEYAARAGTVTKHWWGDQVPREQVGNLPDTVYQATFEKETEFESFDDGVARLALVGAGKANPWGLFDMAGNAWEWTNDWYAPSYYQESPQRNPPGPATGAERVKRGGSWYAYQELKVRAHQAPEDSDDQTGFRCAQGVEKP
ncbi:SUMF1/EgtB/PvdO family nonheme iron enzyme [Nitrospira sp. M1]